MKELSYRQPGLVLEPGGAAAEQHIRDLQRDLRKLGYLKKGIDGRFGAGTALAVRALRHDLLNNQGAGSDGTAPVRVVDYNRGRVNSVTAKVDQALVECIAEMLEDADFPKLPRAENPVEENRKIAASLSQLKSKIAPVPFLMAIFRQESGLRHFLEPAGGDEDSFITVGLDRNQGQPHIVTSRGYGLGQYTLFHHPPKAEEVTEFMQNIEGNIQKAVRELRQKFDLFVNGPTDKADDRQAEIGSGPLRMCRFAESDERFLRDCRRCAEEAGTMEIRAGVTPVFDGAALIFQPTQYYSNASYSNVPVRKNIPCDWPYAVRRYNGGGINSYHYQARVLQHLAKPSF